MHGTPDAAVVWLQGAGDALGPNLEEALRLRLPWTRWYFPDALDRQWFSGSDFPVMESSSEPATLERMLAAVHTLLAEVEKDGIRASRILLGGFGPGAALALLAGRMYPKQLGGVAVMSGWYLRPPLPSSGSSRSHRSSSLAACTMSSSVMGTSVSASLGASASHCTEL